jgi:hypothetical protein
VKKLIRLLGLVLLAVAPAAAHAEWRAAETAHFIIYSESSDRDIAKLAERLERIDGLMRMATAISTDVEPVKVRIYEVESTHHIERALGVANTGIGGFYDSNILGPFAVTPRKTFFGTSLFGPELILHHEYAHHFMLQYFPSVYPSWYVEGFAELIGSSKILDDGKVGYGMPARHRGGEIAAYWVPLDELLLKPPHKIRNLDLYAQGWALTHFLTFSNERAPQLREYLRGLRAGKSPEEAARAFGDLATLNRDARRYVVAGSFPYRAVTVPVEQPVVRSTRPLGPGEAALIPEVIAFRDDDLLLYRKDKDREREQRERQETLVRIRDKASRFARDPFALHLLAEAEYAGGHYSASEAAADRLLALQPDHARGLVRKSLNLAQAARSLQGAARAAKAAEARRLALRANRADPNDALPLLAYYQSFHLAGETPPKEAVVGLARVVATLPRDTTARQLLVDRLAAEKRWREAIAYLQPIANDTHQSPRREAARQQMELLLAELARESGQPPES